MKSTPSTALGVTFENDFNLANPELATSKSTSKSKAKGRMRDGYEEKKEVTNTDTIMMDIVESTIGVDTYDITNTIQPPSYRSQIKILSPTSRKNLFGLTTASATSHPLPNPSTSTNDDADENKKDEQDGLTFPSGTWSPGGEYTQKLLIKNISQTMIKLKPHIPSAKYFSLLYPEVIKLVPGVGVEIEVFFRPVRMEDYFDSIYFSILHDNISPNTTNDEDEEVTSESIERKGFHVPLHAYISTLQGHIPSTLEFGLIPINVTTTKQFELKNTGEVPMPYIWNVPSPYTFTPSHGNVSVGESVWIDVDIHPNAAEVFVSKAICTVGTGVNANKPKPLLQISLSSISKYCYINCSDTSVKFGDVLVGCNGGEGVSKEIVLCNRSSVDAEYYIKRVENDRPSVYTFTPNGGVIKPGDEVNVKIVYVPVVSGTYTNDNYDVITPGGNVTRVNVSAKCIGPTVKIYKKPDANAPVGSGIVNSINFRDVTVGSGVTRVVFIENTSAVEASYNFQTSNQSPLLSFSQTRGVIPPNFTVSVTVKYTPITPTNFYKRVFCQIEHAGIQFLDLLGSGYISARGEIKEQRPAPLRAAHVQAYFNRVSAGLGKIGPSELEGMYSVNKMSKLFAGVGVNGTSPLCVAGVENPVDRSGSWTRNEIGAAREFFEEGGESEVAVDVRTVDFGFVNAGNGRGEERTVSVRNNCKETICVYWNIPGSSDGDGDAGFTITPSILTIPPHTSSTHTITFHPQNTNYYYNHTLECTAYYKSQRSFRLVNDATLQPPWNIPVNVYGHSFEGEQFLPKICMSLKGGVMTFPATYVGDVNVQTFRVNNLGNLPAQFLFDTDLTNTFKICPSQGLINGNDFQLISITFTPNIEQSYTSNIKVMLNNTPSMSQTLQLSGVGSIPRISITNVTKSGLLYLKPTCIGLTSTRKLTLHNPTRLPLIFRVEIPSRYDGVILKVSPRVCRLMGNECVDVTVTFAPRSSSTVRVKAHVYVRPISGPSDYNLRDARQMGVTQNADVVQSVGVTLICPGTSGAITFEPALVDFGVKLVNYTETKEVWLVNEADCDVMYRMLHTLKSGPSDGGGDEVLKNAHVELKSRIDSSNSGLIIMDKPTGVIPARSKLRTKITFQPGNHGEYEFEVVCLIKSVDREGVEGFMSNDQVLLSNGGVNALVGSDVDDADADADADTDTGMNQSQSIPMMIKPLKLILKGSASFPKIIIKDIRVAHGGTGIGCSPMHVHGQLNIPTINKTLLLPLTKTEVDFNMASTPDLKSLPKFEFTFNPGLLKSGKQVMILELNNPETLPVKFSFHLPNEKAIELETWADAGAPSDVELRMNRIIDVLKCFSISDMEGELASGESKVIRISYEYKSLDYDGIHTLPILLKVFQGKQFWLNLNGRTLHRTQPLLTPCTNDGGITRLFPVAIGTMRECAPVQKSEICNYSNVTMNYKIDGKQIAKFNATHGYGLELLHLENPTGEIEAGSSCFLIWRFLPIEVKTLSLDVVGRTMCEEDQDQEVCGKFCLRVVLEGYDPRDKGLDPHRLPQPNINLGLTPPIYQTLVLPTQQITLSQDLINLHRIPQRSTVTKLITLTSTSPTSVRFDTCKPKWLHMLDDHDLDTENGVIRVYPSSGIILPYEQVVVKVCVDGNCERRVVNSNVWVEITSVADENKVQSMSSASRTTDRLNTLKKGRAEKAHESVIGRDTSGKVFTRVTMMLNDALKLKNDHEGVTEIVEKAFNMLKYVGGQSDVNFRFVSDTVIRNLIKGVANEEVSFDAYAAMNGEGENVKELGVVMSELKARYEKMNVNVLVNVLPDPEVKLAFMLYDSYVDEGGLKHTGTGTGNGGAGKVSWTESFDGTMGSLGSSSVRSVRSGGAASKPMSPAMSVNANVNVGVGGGSRGGMRTGTATGNNATGRLGLGLGDVNATPAVSYLAIQVCAEIVDEEAYYGLHGHTHEDGDGIRIPTQRDFILNPYEKVPANVIIRPVNSGLTGSTGAYGTAQESEVARAIITGTFTSLVNSHTLTSIINKLPVKPRGPELNEVQVKLPLMTKLQNTFDTFDVDASGTLTNAELSNAFRMIGLKPNDVDVLNLFKRLDRDGDGEVDLREFLGGLDVELAGKIGRAVEGNERVIVKLRALKQRNLRGIEEEGKDDFDSPSNKAALLIQTKNRERTAAKIVQHKRFMNTFEGQEMSRAALMIQGRARQRKAINDMHAAAEVKRLHKLKTAGQDENLRSMLPVVLGETVYNLCREAVKSDVVSAKIKGLGVEVRGLEEAIGVDVISYNSLNNNGAGKGKEKEKEEKKNVGKRRLLNETIEARTAEVTRIMKEIELDKGRERFDVNAKPVRFFKAN